MKRKPQQPKPSPHPQFDTFVKRVLAYRPPDNEPVKGSRKPKQSARPPQAEPPQTA